MANELHEQEPAATEAHDWGVSEPEPMAIIALWPGDAPPTATEVISMLQQQIGAAFEAQEIERDEAHAEVLWALMFQPAEGAQPIVVWVEPARQAGLEDEAARACRWAIGFQTQLDADDPVTECFAMMRLIAGALVEAPALIDVNSTSVLSGRTLEYLRRDSPIDPPMTTLWKIDAVWNGAPEAQPDEPVWLHTHGLWRLGRPELEMLDVPHHLGPAAGELLNLVASQVVEYGAPPPGVAVEVGAGLAIALQPWEIVAQYVNDCAPGSVKDREGIAEAHTGARAAVCAVEQRGEFRKVWAWPEEAVRRLQEGEGMVYLTARETDRQRELARATWDEFATAFAAIGSLSRAQSCAPPTRFLLKAAFTPPNTEVGNEHLWFHVEHLEGATARGELLNEPIHIPNLHRGERCDIRRDQVTDWSVLTSAGMLGPDALDQLWAIIDKSRERAP